MKNEVVDFAKTIGASDLRKKMRNTIYGGLFKRSNYFILNDQNTFLIVKISRSKLKHFWGVGKQFVEFFNDITGERLRYHVVCLTTEASGWVIPGTYLNSCIEDGSLSYSSRGDQYKINEYNLKDQFRFRTVSDCLKVLKGL